MSRGEKLTSKKLSRSLNGLSSFDSIPLSFLWHCAVLAKKLVAYNRSVCQLGSQLQRFLQSQVEGQARYELRLIHPLSLLLDDFD